MPFFFFLLSRSEVLGASSPGLFDGDDDSGLVNGFAISVSSGDFLLDGLVAVGSS